MIMLPSDNILLAESPCPESVFTATPDIVVLPSGRYIASYEFFQSSTSKERKPELVEQPLRLLFSDDRGASWRAITHETNSKRKEQQYDNHASRPYLAHRCIGEIRHENRRFCA